MQSTASAIAAAAIGGTDLSARANSAKGSDSAAAAGSSGKSSTSQEFDQQEAERWLATRWKSVESSVADTRQGPADRAVVHKPAPGTGGGAWGPNKRTTTTQFTADLTKAAAAAGIR